MKWSNSTRALVLGSTGFVGRHVCEALRADGFEVLEVARRIPNGANRDEFIPLDLSSAPPEEIAGVIDSYHPAVLVNTVGSIWGRDDEEMWSAAAEPVKRVITALEACSHRPFLVHLGSVLEYGTIENGQQASAERSLANPTNAYGQAKLAATEALLEATKSGVIDAMILRVANVSGPGAPAVSLLGVVAEQLHDQIGASSEPQITLNPLVDRRDYLDVRDVASAVVSSARLRKTGAIFDIGRGIAIGVRDLVELLVEISGSGAQISEKPLPSSTKKTANWTSVDIEPARRELYWQPKVSMRTSLEDFWSEFVAEREGGSFKDDHPGCTSNFITSPTDGDL